MSYVSLFATKELGKRTSQLSKLFRARSLGNHIADKRILRIIGMTLRSGVMKDGEKIRSEEGTVQGSPLSPLLSNVVLDELDKELEHRGLEFCRFADDCNIFVKSQKAADRVMSSISKFIENKLKLVVNQDKSKVAHCSAVKFLGMTQYPVQLAKVEAHLRRRLRSRFVGEQKRRRHLFNKLLKRNVSKGQAAKTVFSSKGRWALSATFAVHRAYPNKWFIDHLGQKVR